MSSFRLVALDMDGTLLDSSGRLRDAVTQAVHDAAGSCQVVLATGRDWAGVGEVATRLELNGPLILHNGTQIRWHQPEPWHESTLSEDTVAALLQGGQEFGASWFAFATGSDEPVYFAVPPQHGRSRRFLRSLGSRAAHTPRLEQLPGGRGVLRLTTMLPREAGEGLRDWVLAELGEELKVIHAVDPPGDLYLEVYAATATKGHALKRVARELDVPRSQVLAVGDWLNDVEMLQFAGMGVAMGNAAPEVKEAADWVGADHDADGLAQILRHFILDPSAPA